MKKSLLFRDCYKLIKQYDKSKASVLVCSSAKMKATLFLAIFVVFSVSLATGQCPNSTWIHRGDKCYFVKMEKGDFFENIALCNQLNASLVSIVNKKENIGVAQLANDFWLGLGQKSKGFRDFYWFDGRPFAYNNWKYEPVDTYYKYFAAYSRKGEWHFDAFRAFSQRTQMCSINLRPSASHKKAPNPLDLKVTLVDKQCPNSTWIRRGNKCYFVKTEKADLYENIALCSQLNASLVSIISEEENIRVTRLISQLKVFSIWLGMGQMSKDSEVFYWFDESPFVYDSWRDEPQVPSQYIGARLSVGEWLTTSTFMRVSQVCSLDLRLNTFPKKIPNPAELTEADGQCANKTWKRIGNKCIFLNRWKRMTYMENQALCKEWNATMISIHSEAENIQLTRLFKNHIFWIGLKQSSKSNGLYEWEDGTPVTYESWKILQPIGLGIKSWAAYSYLGSWYWTKVESKLLPCCQISLLTDAEKGSTKSTSDAPLQLITNTKSVDAVSQNTESATDVRERKNN